MNEEMNSGQMPENNQGQPDQGNQGMQGSGEQQKASSVGPTVGIIIILIIIIVGGLYFWGKQIANDRADLEGSDDEMIEDLLDTDSSDDLDSIEADLQGELDGLDEGLNDLDSEL